MHDPKANIEISHVFDIERGLMLFDDWKADPDKSQALDNWVWDNIGHIFMADEQPYHPSIDTPKKLTWEEIRDEFIKLGWKPQEADEELRRMIAEEESGL